MEASVLARSSTCCCVFVKEINSDSSVIGVFQDDTGIHDIQRVLCA